MIISIWYGYSSLEKGCARYSQMTSSSPQKSDTKKRQRGRQFNVDAMDVWWPFPPYPMACVNKTWYNLSKTATVGCAWLRHWSWQWYRELQNILLMSAWMIAQSDMLYAWIASTQQIEGEGERERKSAIDDARKNEIYDQAKHKYVALNKAIPLNFIGNAIHFVIFL